MSETSIVAGKEAERYYPYSSMFYANRHSFWAAGQDSFTLPPAQDQDAFIQLTNVEPVLQGVLQRRRGVQLFSNAFQGQLGTHLIPHSNPPFLFSFPFRSDGLGLHEIVWSRFGPGTAFGPVATDEIGNVLLNPIFNESSDAKFAPRMVLSRDYGFFTDGSPTDSVKWNGTTTAGNVTNWGTKINTIASSTFGPNQAGAGTNLIVGSGAISWANPTNIIGAPDGNSATLTLAAGQGSNRLAGTTYGLTIPATAGPITGIQVSITGSQDANVLGINSAVFLLKAGAIAGAGKFLTLPGATGAVILGANNDLWSSSWSPADVQNSGFGVAVQYNNGSAGTPVDIAIDAISVTVYTAGSALTFTTNTTTTNIVLLNGRTYFYAFQNSKTLTTSDLSTPSVTTGPLTGNQVNITNIPTSPDPQIDTVLILATADGNDETTLFLAGTVPNGTATFVDTIPDSLSATFTSGQTLLTQPLYQDTDAFGNLHGLANNQPPPANLNFTVKHKGRLYGASGRTLFYSKNLDDVTTANGLITSRFEEAWPTINQFDVSEKAETIQGLLSDGETLWIATERAIRRLIGDSPSNFQIPEVEFSEVGLFNQETWKVVFWEGTPIGTMWLTKDFKVMASDFNTYQDVGKPIQDVLNSISTSLGTYGQTPSVFASYVSQGPADYYMLYLPTTAGITGQGADTICIFDLRRKKWSIWRPTVGQFNVIETPTTSLFLIDQFGTPRWFFSGFAVDNFGNQGSLLNEWKQGLLQDKGFSYPVTIQTSWLDMGDYGLRKFLNQIIPTTGDNAALTIQVEAASNEQDFTNPTTVVPATTVIPAAIPDDVFVPLASGPSHHRAFRLTFVSPASTIQNVLTSYSIEAGVFHRY